MEEQPDVLLIVIDACRADALSPYDPAVERTPAAASLDETGTTFRRAISPAPWTLPSATSLLTGDDPHEHGATSTAYATDRPTLADDLSAAGYRCVHVSPKTWIGEWLPQGRGFDEVVEFTGPTHRRFEAGEDVRSLSAGVARGPEWYATVAHRALRSDAPLRSLGNAAAFKLAEATGDAWLDDVRASGDAAAAVDDQLAASADDDRPLFAYVHLMDPHLPFFVPAGFASDVRPPGCSTVEEERQWMESLMDDAWAIRTGERRLSEAEVEFLRARYADEVAYADAAVGSMLDSLGENGLADETLVALTADHGEHLGERVVDPGDPPEEERTMVDHQASVRIPVLRVPLLLRYPGCFEADERGDLVQPHYVAETVRALAGLDYDRSRSLLPGDAEALRDVALVEYDGVVSSHPPEPYADARVFARRRATVRGDWKLDDVEGERRAARIDWATNESTAVPIDDLPADARETLEAALVRAEGGGDAAAGDDRDEAMPGAVERRLENLGYL